MEIIKDCTLVCKICEKEFSSISTRNRHIRNFHDDVTIEEKKTRIQCPLCHEEVKFSYYEHLIEHLKQLHKLTIMEYVLSFRNFEEFEAWRALDNRDVDYACYRRFKRSNGDEDIYYNCNRSDSRGFTSTCSKRKMKLGGSIRIQGVCPSRIIVKVQKNGMIAVKFVETHVGHADELRSKRLSKTEQNTLVKEESDMLCIDEPTTSQIRYQNDFESRREIALDGICLGICTFGRSLDEELFDKFMVELNKIKDKFQQNITGDVCRKRKIEDQLYHPNKK